MFDASVESIQSELALGSWQTPTSGSGSEPLVRGVWEKRPLKIKLKGFQLVFA